MTCHKILIDYTEYVRLKGYERQVEDLTRKSGSNLSGSGTEKNVTSYNESEPIDTDRKRLETPSSLDTRMIQKEDSITLPPSAMTITPTEEVSSKSGTNSKWYFLGPPKKT